MSKIPDRVGTVNCKRRVIIAYRCLLRAPNALESELIDSKVNCGYGGLIVALILLPNKMATQRESKEAISHPLLTVVFVAFHDSFIH